MIVGILGKKRHGKDSLGTILAGYWQLESNTALSRVDKLAAPIKTAAREWFDLTRDQVEGINYDREQPLEGWDGLTVRRILQTIGTEVGRNVHPDVWVRLLLKRHRRAQLESPKSVVTVVPDVRFRNEVEWIRKEGGCIVYIVRPGFESDDGHASEAHIEELGQKADHAVLNDGALDDLIMQGRTLARTLATEL